MLIVRLDVCLHVSIKCSCLWAVCVYVCVFLRTQQRPASRVSLIKILMASPLHANGSNGKAK